MEKPGWLYKPADIKNVNNISDEVYQVYKKHYPDIFEGRGFTFTYINKEILRAEAPSYISALVELGLYDKWATSIFVGTQGEHRQVDSPIHVDTEDWQSRCYALNIPVVNCDDSYTVFYDPVTRDPDAYLSGDSKAYATARGFSEEGAVELGRWPVKKPAWVNVCIPHRAENSNSETRLIISTRFWPEIHDYFNS